MSDVAHGELAWVFALEVCLGPVETVFEVSANGCNFRRTGRDAPFPVAGIGRSTMWEEW
jgi:hypothetical protein